MFYGCDDSDIESYTDDTMPYTYAPYTVHI